MTLELGPVIGTFGVAVIAAAGCVLDAETAADFSLFGCPAFHAFCVLRGFRAALYMIVAENVPGFAAVSAYQNAPWIVAGMIGAVTGFYPRAKSGALQLAGQDVAVLIATLFAPFDTLLLSYITQFVDKRVADFLREYEQRYRDVTRVKSLIAANLDRETYVKQIKPARSVSEAMERYLRLVGKAKFTRDMRHLTPP
jgi:hypothetical protein